MVLALIEGHKSSFSSEADPVVFGPRTGFEDRLIEAKEQLDELTAEQDLLVAVIKGKLQALTTAAAPTPC